MSGKLDQSLDQILKDNRKPRRSARPRPANGAKTAGRPAPPVGGVKKAIKSAKPAKAAAARSIDSDSKVLVSRLPSDVGEKQIQEYFHATIGNVKKVLLSYGPNGKSRGVATIIFSKADAAAKAAKAMDGVKVDNHPMKVEVILGANDAPAPAAPKGLKDRITGVKAAVKAQPKPVKTAGPKPGKGKKDAKKGAPRKPKKTLEELDEDMNDYFNDDKNKPAGESDTAMGNGGAVQPTAGGDTGMDDEIL